MGFYQKQANHKPSETQRIPEELRRLPQWMGTRFAVREDGKTDKPPYRVRRGERIIKADKTNPENWSTFEEALDALRRGDVDAIGFVFTEDDAFYVVDLDGVVHEETGEASASALQIVHAVNSYAELSCSRTGIHVVGRGTKPEYAGCKNKDLGFGIEVYDKARFVVMTGNRIGNHTSVMDRQAELDALCQKLWPKRDESRRRRQKPQPVNLDNLELLERARDSRTGKKFRKLYDHGDISEYPSQSEADWSLLNMLIFWTAGDRDRIIGLFKASALYRPKGKRRNYVEDSTDNALSSYVGHFYRPRKIEVVREEDPEDPLTPYLKLLLDPSVWRGRKGASAYKTYAAAIIRATEHGIVGDDGSLRIGCDTRTLAEIAGVNVRTLRRSALPYLVQEMKLLRWQRGKGRQAGSFVLENPEKHMAQRMADSTSAPNKVSNSLCGNSIGGTYGNSEEQLQTLRLLIRMRSGHTKSAKLLRLGMPAMFTTIALVAGGVRRGQKITDLSDRTGRSVYELRGTERYVGVLPKLKAVGIVREVSGGVYRLTDDFAERYERALEHSGITYSERAQRRRHADDRRRRDEQIPVEKPDRDLRGKEHMHSVLEERRQEAKRRWVEEQRRKVGTTAATFLADEMDGRYGPRVSDTIDRWRNLHGGTASELWDAIRYGPFVLRRVSGELYVDPEGEGAAAPTGAGVGQS